MLTFNRHSGLRIKVPSTFTVSDPETTPSRRSSKVRTYSPIPLPTDHTSEAMHDAVIQALEHQDMQVVDQVEFEPIQEPARQSTRRGTLQAPQTVAEFEVPLAPYEDAVLLLEQNGMYSWNYASEPPLTPVQPTRRGGGAVTTQRRVTFRITLPSQGAPKPQSARRGIVEDFIIGKIRAYVLKFAARVAVDETMKFLERDVRRGLIHMKSNDPVQWEPVDDLALSGLPLHRPARILLFVHGIFSSTIGGFGALSGTPWGHKFLEGARSNYDAVIGFDHATLCDDPLANATDLLKRLQRSNWTDEPQFDVIAHGRGGLVIRSLIEHILPVSNWHPQFGRVIFVASPNGGTLLAEPENWQALIDLYTNLAVGACRLLGMIPQAKATTLVLQEIIQGVGAFVKYCAIQTVSQGGVPGLAAMEPNGRFITQLNQVQPGQPTIEKSYYCAITSEFKPTLSGDHEPRELPQRLLQWLVEGFMAGLMHEANDLVVHTASMSAIDPQVGKYIKDSLDFGVNPQVYHTNYFIRPEVTNALTRWLNLVEPVSVIVTGTAPGRSVIERSGAGGTPGGKVQGASPGGASVHEIVMPRTVSTGMMVRPETPAAVDTDILVTSADAPVSELRAAIDKQSPSYIVVSREYKGEILNYAFAGEEALEKTVGRDKTTPLIEAFNLHETDASNTLSIDEPMEPLATDGGSVTTRRSVVVAGNRPIGVLPEKAPLPNATDLVGMANVAAKPTQDIDRIVTRRAMPTFAAPPQPARPSGTLKMTCHFHAEMDKEVIVKRAITVEVLVSREIIDRVTGEASAGGSAEINPERKLHIQVIPRINFELIGEGRVEIDPPQPGAPQQVYFDLRPTNLGAGEVWVAVRQGQVPLVTLSLKTQIVNVKSEVMRKNVVIAATGEAPRLREPLHQLWIRERSNGGTITYSYELYSEGLKIREWVESQPFIGSREQYVDNLYKEIENRWLSNKDDVKNFTQELRAFGANLLEELIPPKLQQTLWCYRNQIESIQVISTEPFIPWELVHLKEPGRALPAETRFLGQMGLVRWLHEAGWPPDQLMIRKGRVRYVIPNYPHPDYILPAAKQETLFLQEKFLATAVAPESGEVRKLISQPGAFDLLHFACHGSAEQDNIANACLLMEGRIEGQSYIPDYFSATIAEQFSNLKGPDDHCPMIVLNACQAGRAGYKLTGVGGFAQAFIKGGAGVFIGTLWSVGDSPARTFTETFYSALLDNSSIAEATIKARSQAEQVGDATWLAYVVYGHPHAKINGQQLLSRP